MLASAPQPVLERPPFWRPWMIPDLLAWWNPYRLTGLADGDDILQIPDLSGNGYTLSEAAPNVPSYEIGELGNKPIARFDRTNTERLDAHALAPRIAGTDVPFTIAGVVKLNTLAPPRQIYWYFSYTVADAPIHQLHVNAGAWRVERRDDANNLVAIAGGVPDLKSHIVVQIFSGTTVAVYFDGQPMIPEAAMDVGTLTLDKFSFGVYSKLDTNPMSMDWGEHVMYSRGIGTGERLQLEQYLGRFWGVPIS